MKYDHALNFDSNLSKSHMSEPHEQDFSSPMHQPLVVLQSHLLKIRYQNVHR